MDTVDALRNDWLDDPAQTERLDMDRFHKERSDYGVSEYDVWNFDTYIAQVIANGCLWLKTHASGYPGDISDKEWGAYLDSIREPLLRWVENEYENMDEYKKLYENAKEAMHKFAERFGNFWD